jgi:toxin-antitoxin system PIN domain toxin
MSFSIDVNLLLYASDSSGPEHPRASTFLRDCAAGGQVFCLAWPTLMGYLRMATHPRIFTQPLTPQAAMANVEALMGLPHCRVIGERERFWAVYRQVTGDLPTRGNLVPDAHLAAILRQNGIGVLYTHDRDFRKFDFLDVRDPLASDD